MRPVILVPTDFSENALLAGRYATALAQYSEASVCFLHAYTWLQSAFQGGHENEAAKQEARENAREEMESFLENISELPARPESVLAEGHLSDAIKAYCSQREVRVIVMGTSGASGLKYHVLGSNAYEIAKIRKTVPLVVVPPGVSSFEVSRIAFFTDFNQGDIRTLEALKSVLPGLSSEIRLIHFGERHAQQEEENKLKEWAEYLNTTTGISNLTALWVEGEEGVEAVEQLNEPFDLLTLTLVGHTFFETLFSKSMAKELVHQSKIPVFLTTAED